MVYFFKPSRRKYFAHTRHNAGAVSDDENDLLTLDRSEHDLTRHDSRPRGKATVAHVRSRGITVKPRDRKKNLAQRKFADTNVLQNTADDKFYPFNVENGVPVLPIEIRGKTIKAVCDTGASLSLCCANNMKTIFGPHFKNYLRPSRVKIIQADGSDLSCMGEITLQFKVQGHYFTDTFQVYDARAPTCLLAFGFFAKYDLAVFKEGIGTVPRPIPNDRLDKTYNLIVGQDMCLPAHSTCFVVTHVADEHKQTLSTMEKFRLLGKQCGIYELDDSKLQAEVIHAKLCLSNSPVVVILNRLDQPDDLILKEGQNIARLQNCDDNDELAQCFLTPKVDSNDPIESPQGGSRKEKLHKFYEQYIEKHISCLKPTVVHELNADLPYHEAITNLIRGTVKGQDAQALAILLTECSACNVNNFVKCAFHTHQYKSSLGIQNDRELVYNCVLCNFMCGKWADFHNHVGQTHGVEAGKRSSEPNVTCDVYEQLGTINMAIDKMKVQGDQEKMLITSEGLSIGSQGLAPSLDVEFSSNLTEKLEEDFLTSPSMHNHADVPGLRCVSRGTSTWTDGSDGTVKDVKKLFGSDISSRPPSCEPDLLIHDERSSMCRDNDNESNLNLPVNQAKEIVYDIEHEDLKLDDINFYYTGPGSEDLKKDILDIVAKVPELWSKTNYDLGKFKYEVKVPLKRKLPHFSDPHRSTHPHKIPAANALLEQLQKNEAMALGMSPWSSPAVWTQKAAGDAVGGAGKKEETNIRGLRLAVDYRKANLNVRNVACPAPSAKQLINTLAGKKYATMLDIAHGFWCVTIDELASQYFSVQALGRIYHFFRLPMGSLSSPAIFIFCLIYTVRGLEAFCLVYADNLTVVSNTLKQHKKHIEMVLKRLQHYGWKIKLSKIHFVLHDTPLKFLGFYFDLKHQMMYPCPEKIKTISELERPNTVRTVRRLLGSLNFYSSFIPNMQHVMIPISNLLKGKGDLDQVVWTREAENAWLHMKLLISQKLQLSLPDYNLNKFHLITDASPVSVASALMQRSEEGEVWKELDFDSKKLNPVQQRWAQVELELFAIINGLKHNRDMLMTAEVFIHTDCRALLYLTLFESCSPKLSRWLTYLNSFNHKLLFESSTTPLIKHIDFLTRTSDAVPERETYSRVRKTAFDKLPPITLEDLDGKAEMTHDEYMP